MTIKRVFLFLALFFVWVSTAACQQTGSPSRASDYIKNGNACYANKEYSKAISIYTKAVNEDPKDMLAALAHYKCAKAFSAMGKYDNAISECSKSIAIDPLMGMGMTYLLRGLLYEETGKYEDAFSDYSKVLIINPNDKTAKFCRERIQLRWYTDSTNQGLALFDIGVIAYNRKDNVLARKELERALSLFAQARSFATGDKAAFGMACFTKALLYQMVTGEILNTIKPDESNRAAVTQPLCRAYYTLAVTNAYYERALLCLQDEKLINSVKEHKSANDRDIAVVRGKLTGLFPTSDKQMKASELEAACIVNFDLAGDLLAAGDHDGAKLIIDKNEAMSADLKRLKGINANGIGYLSSAYARINTILSYPLTDMAWMKTNKRSLENEINASLDDLNRAKSELVNAAFLNKFCSGLLENVSALQKLVEKTGG